MLEITNERTCYITTYHNHISVPDLTKVYKWINNDDQSETLKTGDNFFKIYRV